MSFTMEDRLTQGFLAGLAGWLPQTIFTYIMYGFHLTKCRYLEFAAVLTFNHKPEGLFEILFAEFGVIIFQGILGIGFSMFLKAVSDLNIFLKGWLYGIFVWFAVYAVMTIFQLKYIYPVDTHTAVVNLMAASIWSIGMTWIYVVLNRKYTIKN